MSLQVRKQSGPARRIAHLLAIAGGSLASAIAHGAITRTGDSFGVSGIDYVGYNTSGTLTIDAGTVFQMTGSWVAYQPAASGVLTIDGAGTAYKLTDEARIGDMGPSATLNITNGAAMESSLMYFAYSANNTANVTVNGSSLKNSTFYIGNSGHATLTTTGSTLTTTNTALIGAGTGSVGTASLTSTPWAITNSLWVGDSGSGTLTLNSSNVTLGGQFAVNYGNTASTVNFNNATVTAGHSLVSWRDLNGTGTINTGGWIYDQPLSISSAAWSPAQIVLNNKPGQNITVNINRTASSIFGVGAGGIGSFALSGGYQLNTGSGFLGISTFAQATGVISGAGSKWTMNDSLFLGHLGTANLTLTGGGSMSSVVAFIGDKAGATGNLVVEGAGSGWTNNWNTYIGYSGNGSMTVRNGAVVTVGWATLGRFNGSNGSMTVDNATFSGNSDALIVGSAGKGSLIVRNGGSVSSYSLDVGKFTTGSTVDITSGSSLLTGNVLLAESVVGDAILRIDGAGSNLRATGNVEASRFGNSTIKLLNGGTMRAGTMTFSTKNVLDIALAPYGSQYLIVDTNAMLAGQLKLSVGPGTPLSYQQTFEILDIGGTRSGTFAGAPEGAMLGDFGGMSLRITYLGGDGNDVVLTAIPEPSAILVALALAPLARRRTRRSALTLL